MLEGCTPWPQEFAARYRRDGYWEDITLREMLDVSVRLHGTKPALVFGDRRISYRELVAQIDRLAIHLHDAGLRPLDRVVVHLPNIPEFVTTFFALMTLGVIPVLALPAHRHTEIHHFIRHSRAVGYFIPETVRGFDYRPLAENLRAEFEQHLKYVFVAGTPYRRADPARGRRPWAQFGRSSVADSGQTRQRSRSCCFRAAQRDCRS